MFMKTEAFSVGVARSGMRVTVSAFYDFELRTFSDPLDDPYFSGLLTLKVGSQSISTDPGSEVDPPAKIIVTLGAGKFISGSVAVKDNVSGEKHSGSFNIGYFTAATTYAGTAGANYVQGSTANDVLSGRGGNDCLDGNKGNDTLDGGAGNDTLYGGPGNNVLNGGDGNDYLQAGSTSSKDQLFGGRGNDTYVFRHAGTKISDTGGIDTVVVPFSYTLKADFEKLTLDGQKPINGTGNAKPNTIIGNHWDNVLSGLGGNDVLDGQLGNDKIFGGAGVDRLNGSYGDDTVSGGAGNDFITGGDGKDLLDGGSGNDRIDGGRGVNDMRGGAGNDTLTGQFTHSTISGGSGSDTFAFSTVTNRFSPVSQRDVITDFVSGVDVIDLRLLDARFFEEGNNAFTFIGTNAFSNQQGELRYFIEDKPGDAGDRTVIEGDLFGDGTRDFQIELSGIHILTSADFRL